MRSRRPRINEKPKAGNKPNARSGAKAEQRKQSATPQKPWSITHTEHSLKKAFKAPKRDKDTLSTVIKGEKPVNGKGIKAHSKSLAATATKGANHSSPKASSFLKRPASRLAKSYKAKNVKPIIKSEEQQGEVRLNRYIANAGVCSRREADQLILQGLIEVNGKVVTELGTKVKPGDVVKYDGKTLRKEPYVYILLNKPKDYITTTDDPQDRKTVMSLVANATTERIYPVGRLDRNTTGLLLLTNDGELTEKLAHPSNKVAKVYQVDLDKPITAEDLEKIKKGVHLEDGVAHVDEVQVLSLKKDIVGISLHIGKNRIVRRIFEHLGYTVVRLDRVMYAGLTKKNLPRGHWRYLTEKEVINLKYLNSKVISA